MGGQVQQLLGNHDVSPSLGLLSIWEENRSFKFTSVSAIPDSGVRGVGKGPHAVLAEEALLYTVSDLIMGQQRHTQTFTHSIISTRFKINIANSLKENIIKSQQWLLWICGSKKIFFFLTFFFV